MERRFEGNVAFVTGAATGIGQATAVRLASEGALVGVNHLPSSDPAPTLKRIKEAGGEGFAVPADVRDPKQVVSLVEQVAKRGGRLDYVVSNAGINPSMRWDETTVEQFDELSETNFRGIWLVCTEGAKQMITVAAMGGKVLEVGSAMGTVEIDAFTELQPKELQIIDCFQPAAPVSTHHTFPWTQQRNRQIFMQMTADGQIRLDHLITHTVSSTDAVRVFEMVKRGGTDWLGIVFTWHV